MSNSVGTKKQVWAGEREMTSPLGLRKEDLMINDKGNIVAKKKGRKAGTIADKKPNPWIVHLKKVRSENPDLSFKQAIIKAKQSYKKPSGTTGKVRDAKTEPVQELTRGETKKAKVSKIKKEAPKRKAPKAPKAPLIAEVGNSIDRMKSNAQAILSLKGKTSVSAKLAKIELKKEQAELKKRILSETMKK